MSTTSRRNVLKFIGLGGITTAIAPAVLLQACKEAATAAQGYAFATLSAGQSATVKAVQDLIIPRTDTPSASEVGSVEFLDTFITHAYKPEDRTRLLHQLDLFAAKLKESHSVSPADATEEHLGAMMEQYFVKHSAPEKPAVEMEIEGNKIDVPSASGDAALVYEDDATEINKMLKGIRSLTLESYFSSEKIATEVLNYLPVPGPYIGQMPIADLPNGVNWSL
ncbi:MAG: gluconate 2-dehydrogenase subunit 3 family protein [Saprospiraceae bacterium]